MARRGKKTRSRLTVRRAVVLLMMTVCVLLVADIFLGAYGSINHMPFPRSVDVMTAFSASIFVDTHLLNQSELSNKPIQFPVFEQIKLEGIVLELMKPRDNSSAKESIFRGRKASADERRARNTKVRNPNAVVKQRVQQKLPVPNPIQKAEPRPHEDILRQFQCDNCFTHNFSYLIENDDICKLQSKNQTIDLLFLVTTVHKNRAARDAIRSTWLSVAKGNTANIRYVFLLGSVADVTLMRGAKVENDQYKDIISEDFVDSYTNLTLKSIMGYKWASTKCHHAKVIVKTDDDMFVNVPALLNVTETHKAELQNTVIGSCNDKGAKPHRNKKSKWFASMTSYSAKQYPGFCSGTCYVTSMAVVEKVYQVSATLSFFHLEDVYMGLCLHKIKAQVKNIPGFNRGREKLDPCLYKGKQLITSHFMSPENMEEIWRLTCRKK